VPAHVPLAVTTRGGVVECVHYGSIAVVDNEGRLLFSAGDADGLVFGRSSLKPFQAMPLIAHPDCGRYHFTPREIALLCASHSGEPRHTELVLELLARIGCDKRDLQCGVHAPLYMEAIGSRPYIQDVFTPLHHNCSGKHAGMLALSRLLDAPVENYLDSSHPVQLAILDAVTHFTAVPASHIKVGVDGCSAPNFAMPLRAMARAYACLTRREDDAYYGDAPRRIFEAMTGSPEMVSGIKRIDLAVMHAGAGDWLSKSGAEAVHGLAFRSRGWGAAIKIADGAPRALHVVVVDLLRQLGLLQVNRDSVLSGYVNPALENWRGTKVGEVLPVFSLQDTHRGTAPLA
jgi:L-asparaginase II